MITARYKSAFDRIFRPIAQVIKRLGLTPNMVTVLGLLFGIAACGFFLYTRDVLIFSVLVLAAGLLDAVDGTLARLTGQVSKFGAYLDAMCDRFFEGIVGLTVAMYSGYWALIFLGMLGSFGVSYAKARAAMEVPVSNTEWPDLMERLERDMLFILGFFISYHFGIKIAGRDLFFWVLIVIDALVYLTVIQRILRAKKLIEERS